MGRLIARLAAGLAALALWAAGFIAGLTGATYFQPQAEGFSVSDRGTARVADCLRVGPVSREGFGHWWVCQADVVWDSGDRERVTAQPGQLTPDDGGQDVAVVERLEVPGKSAAPPVSKIYRAEFEPDSVLGFGSIAGGTLIGFVLALIVFGSTLSATGRKNETRGTR